MQLDPRDEEFIVRVDALLESVPSDYHKDLIPTIFRFFEKYPFEDCGAPGTLVHLIEHFYPSYRSILLDSLARTPSYNAILMINRILNSELGARERQEYLSTLQGILALPNINPALAEKARKLIEYQNEKQG